MANDQHDNDQTDREMRDKLRIAYTIELTRDEYRSAMMMCDRGYLAGITVHASNVEPSDDEDNRDTMYRLEFTEPDAWKCLEQQDDDPPAVWAMTTTRTSLGEKVLKFLEGIV